MKSPRYLRNLKQPNRLSQLLFSISPIIRCQIVGTSMLPTFQPGTVVFINTVVYHFRNPQADDIVALKDPRTKRLLIKRILYEKNKRYFVAGDNATASTDSWTFGPLPKSALVGKVIDAL